MLPPPQEAPVRDGRDSRWTAHRAKRRRQLVESALKAIRAHGPGVGMDEIAAQAKTSKTVLYRHLGDKAGLYHAVVAAVDELILADLDEARQAGEGDIIAQIEAMVRAYLTLVEKDPEIYRFVMTRPLEHGDANPGSGAGSAPSTSPSSGSGSGAGADPVHQISDRIGSQLALAFAEHLRATGRAENADQVAAVWAHGLVGFVRAAADHWLSHPGLGARAILSIDDITSAVVSLIRPSLGGTHPPQADTHRTLREHP